MKKEYVLSVLAANLLVLAVVPKLHPVEAVLLGAALILVVKAIKMAVLSALKEAKE